MLRRIRYVAAILFLATWTTIPIAGQIRRGQDLKIELQGQTTLPFGYSLQLIDATNRSFIGVADVDAFGGFSFRSVPPGDYMIRLIDISGSVMREEAIRFDGVNNVLRLNLTNLPERSRPTGERVSVKQLQNPPSKRAVKAFVEAQKRSEAGQHEQAAALLQKAIEFSPHFAHAHTNLAAQYLHMRQYEKAIELANRAMEIGSPNVHDLCNRGLGLWALGRPGEALQSARQALNLDRRAPIAHYIIGSLLSLNKETLPDAIRHLEIASEQNPSAAKNLEKARQLLAGL